MTQFTASIDMIIPITVIVIGGLLVQILFYWIKGFLDLPKKIKSLEVNIVDIKEEQKEYKTILKIIKDALVSKKQN